MAVSPGKQTSPVILLSDWELTVFARLNASVAMDQSYFREQADRYRRLPHNSSDPVLQVSLRRPADDYQMKADELENDEISAGRADPND
jgi:hypothetical protein